MATQAALRWVCGRTVPISAASTFYTRHTAVKVMWHLRCVVVPCNRCGTCNIARTMETMRRMGLVGVADAELTRLRTEVYTGNIKTILMQDGTRLDVVLEQPLCVTG